MPPPLSRPAEADPAPAADRNPATLWLVLGAAALLRLLNLGALITNDEAISALAARGVATTGVPLLPSGVVYIRDALYHYALGATFVLPGPDELVGRLLGAALSVVAVLGTHRLALALFGSPAVALGAALLAAIDPFSASYAGRLRMYSALQAATVWTLVLFERDFVPRRPRTKPGAEPADENPAPGTRGFGAVLLFAAAFLTQRLAALVVPALAAVWLAERGWRRSGLTWIVPAAALAAVAILAPPLLPSLREPSGLGAVQGTYLSAPDLEAGDLDYLAALRAKLPSGTASTARAAVFTLAMAAAAAGVLRRPAWRRPGLRLLAYAVVPAALVLLWPTGVFYDPRYFLHLLPQFAVLLAAGAVAWAPRPMPAPNAAVILAATAASACFLLWGTPVWQLRYPAFVLPLAAGLATMRRPPRADSSEPAGRDLGARPGSSPLERLPRRIREVVRALAWPGAAMAFALPLTGAALWWIAVLPFDPALRHAAAQGAARDVVLADGHVPLVAWHLGEVDGATPNYSLNVVHRDGRPLGDLYAGARPVGSAAELAVLARESRLWWFVHHPGGLDAGHAAFVAQRVEPLRRYAAEHFRAALRCGSLTLFDSQPAGAGAPTLGCDGRPLAAAAAP